MNNNDRLKDIKILASALVANVFPQEEREKIIRWLANQSGAKNIVKAFGNSKLTRQLNLVRKDEKLPILEEKGNKVVYVNEEIGEKRILYKSPLPGELQARLSYESIADRFLEYLQKVHHIVVLNESFFHVQVFIPHTKEIDFTEEWNKFITQVAFSADGYPKYQLPGLLNTFVLLLNTVKLAVPEEPYKGFGVPELPIITGDQANLVAAWYYAILHNQLAKNKLSDEHKNNLFALKIKYPQKSIKIEKLSKQFKDLGLQQIGITKQRIPKLFEQLEYLINLEQFDLKPKQILSESPIEFACRKAGDDNSSNFCYSCGVGFTNKEKKYDAIKFIFQSSNQRLQSSNNEKQPKICSTCMSVAIASPLKLSHRNIILELTVSQQNNHNLKIHDYLRMLTNKEINIFSGKYILMPSEYIIHKQKVFVSQKLGQIQYALLKTASIFPLEVLEDFKFNLILQGNQSKELLSRYLIFLKGLMDNYGQKIIANGDINLKLGDAVRYVEQDSPYLAEYTIVRESKTSNPLDMEKVREKYGRLLQQDMSVNSKRAKLYQDVAALTGITYPFVDYAEYLIKKHQEERESKQEKKSSKEDLKKEVAREISKIIENSDESQKFCHYSCLGNENRFEITATLKRNRNTHFIYDQAKKLLLEELKITDLKEKSNNGELVINLSLGDVEKVYFHFANDPEYSNDQGWNKLTYNLKLSLYTRFPELVRKLNKKGDK